VLAPQGMFSGPGLFTVMSKVTELQMQVASWIGLLLLLLLCLFILAC
jgi:MFS-type transporter involved in bile tolerance (Atg22 family)